MSFRVLTAEISHETNFLVITYCDHDDDGTQVEVMIEDTEIKGYIPLVTYF